MLNFLKKLFKSRPVIFKPISNESVKITQEDFDRFWKDCKVDYDPCPYTTTELIHTLVVKHHLNIMVQTGFGFYHVLYAPTGENFNISCAGKTVRDALWVALKRVDKEEDTDDRTD